MAVRAASTGQLRHQERVPKLALLNTLVYPKLSLAVAAFVGVSFLPVLSSYLVSPEGLAHTMAQVARDLPQAQTTCFEHAGHFLQEERGLEVGELLGAFFGD